MADKDQADVLKKKDNVTRSKLGLQQWGDEAEPGPADHTPGGGTAERQAGLARGQREAGSDVDKTPEVRGPSHADRAERDND